MRFLFVCACMFYSYLSISAKDYDGDNMLSVLGAGASTTSFKEFKEFWLLEKDNQNFLRGIKVYINPANDKVESIIIASGALGSSNFKRFNSKLPFGILLDDNVNQLTVKLGTGGRITGRNAIKFNHNGVAIEALYSDLKTGKILFIKFSTEIKGAGGVVASGASGKSKITGTVIQSPFKKALLDVFKASRESSFALIKTGERTDGNFWNYKYTYNTNLTIPGQKYNMLYSFPFVTSQLDFVVVLKESDTFEKSMGAMYHDFEKQLTLNFPTSEGWIASCLPGKDKSQLQDLEFRNDKYGAIILDHTKTPKGKHVLYLRFLLFSN